MYAMGLTFGVVPNGLRMIGMVVLGIAVGKIAPLLKFSVASPM